MGGDADTAGALRAARELDGPAVPPGAGSGFGSAACLLPDSLTAVLAHEINTPLAYLLANLAFLGERLDPSSHDPEVGAALHECVHGAKRIAAAVRALRVLGPADDAARRPIPGGGLDGPAWGEELVAAGRRP